MKRTLMTLGLALGLPLAAAPALFAGSALQEPASSPQKADVDGSTKCPVTGRKLAATEGVTVSVKGNSYRVSDDTAGKELSKHPDKYLNADGTPKNQ